MIVVVEGISAAGKTTFSRQFGVDHWVPEFETTGPPPTDEDGPDEHARFWLEHNIRRFQAALAAERLYGFAICDTEPLKCHFDWCMARAGFAPMDVFECAVPLIREAISDELIGFGDRYYVKHISAEAARAQKEADKTRSRRRFEMHLALQMPLMDWFTALSEVLPGQVEFQLPSVEELLCELNNKAPEVSPRRFDISIFDALLARLPT